jgi:SAM-dependent methyltransferase
MPKLTDKQDAYGHEIYDYLCGKRTYEVVEREDGYIDFSAGPIDYFAEYEKWPLHQRQAIRLARGKVLDIGCGAGRTLLYLQHKGLDCVGIDNSLLVVKTCKKRGCKKVMIRSITGLGPDMGIFNTITMFGNNFGLFGTYKRAKWLLRKMYRMTSENGRIISEVMDPYGTTLPEHLWYHKYNRKRGRMSGQLRIRIRYKKYASPFFDYLFVSKKELEDILDGTGWKVKKYCDTKGPAYMAVMEKE